LPAGHTGQRAHPTTRFDCAPFDCAPFDCAPFDYAPFDYAQGKQDRQDKQAYGLTG